VISALRRVAIVLPDSPRTLTAVDLLGQRHQILLQRGAGVKWTRSPAATF
jgi:hypothetical protein